MKFLSKILLLTVFLTAVCDQQVFQASHEVKDYKLEKEIYECVRYHLKNFKDLTIFNIKSKLNEIERFRCDLLKLIKESKYEISKYKEQEIVKYEKLEDILEHFVIEEALRSISDFKKILKLLPKKSSSLINDNLENRTIRAFLGFN